MMKVPGDKVSLSPVSNKRKADEGMEQEQSKKTKASIITTKDLNTKCSWKLTGGYSTEIGAKPIAW